MHVARANVAGIVELFCSSMVKVKPGAKVITIKPCGCFKRGRIVDAVGMRMEEVVALFSGAFGRVSALRVVDELVCDALLVSIF